MLGLSDLSILKKNLVNLSEVPYFNVTINSYINDLLSVVRYCIDNFSNIDTLVITEVITLIWQSYNHLSGSTSRNIPFEMEFLLSKVVSRWVNEDFIITTAASDNKFSFYCWNVNVLSELTKLLPGISLNHMDSPIVHIAMPGFYTKIPLYTVPMYHEVGHFIDNYHGIRLYVAYTTDDTVKSYIGLPMNVRPDVLESHISEFFCDLLSACFVGDKISDFLMYVAPNAPISETHPATAKRQEIVGDFIAGRNNPIVDIFQATLSAIGLPRLEILFDAPNLDRQIRQIETYRI